MGVKKGNIPWNKGIKTGFVPKSAFKKGTPAWNKGLPGLALEKHPNWKGGRCLIKGYPYIKMKGHPDANCNGYVREHRYIMETKLGRPLLKEEVVHHIDGNKINNHPDNLELIENQSNHIKLCHNNRDELGRILKNSNPPFHY